MHKVLKNGLFCVLALSSAILFSCKKDGDVSRSEAVRFYSSDAPQKSITYLQLPLEGVTGGEIYIESNTPVSVETQLPAAEMLASDPWISIEVTKKSDCVYLVKYSAAPLKGGLSQRTACINATSTQMYLGSYLKLCQGYELFWTNSFTDREHLVLDADEPSWSTGVITDIAATSWDYLAFKAYAVNPSAVSVRDVYPVEISIPEGTYFETTGRTTYVADVPLGDSFADASLIYMPFKSTAGGFSSEMTITFRSAGEDLSGLELHIDDIKIYKVSDQLREVLEGGDYADGGGESFE